MYTAKILGVEKERIQESGEDQLAVSFELSDGSESSVFREGFPLDTSEDVIEEAVQARLSLYKQERERAEANKEADALQAQADETISKLEGKKLKLK
jgi:hypothetical protein